MSLFIVSKKIAGGDVSVDEAAMWQEVERIEATDYRDAIRLVREKYAPGEVTVIPVEMEKIS